MLPQLKMIPPFFLCANSCAISCENFSFFCRSSKSIGFTQKQWKDRILLFNYFWSVVFLRCRKVTFKRSYHFSTQRQWSIKVAPTILVAWCKKTFQGPWVFFNDRRWRQSSKKEAQKKWGKMEICHQKKRKFDQTLWKLMDLNFVWKYLHCDSELPTFWEKKPKATHLLLPFEKKVFVRTFTLSIRASHIMSYKTTHVDKWYERIVFFCFLSPSVNESFYVCNKKNSSQKRVIVCFLFTPGPQSLKTHVFNYVVLLAYESLVTKKSFFKGD